jgi:hypothetical protein
VAPNPPREVDELELVELLLRPVEVSAVDTAAGARRDQYECVFEE